VGKKRRDDTIDDSYIVEAQDLVQRGRLQLKSSREGSNLTSRRGDRRHSEPVGDGFRAGINLCMGTHTQHMSKNIAISDDVYRRLKREKGDRSFSEVIADKLDGGGEISDVTGQGIFDAETPDTVADEIERLSEGTMDRVTDEDL